MVESGKKKKGNPSSKKGITLKRRKREQASWDKIKFDKHKK